MKLHCICYRCFCVAVVWEHPPSYWPVFGALASVRPDISLISVCASRLMRGVKVICYQSRQITLQGSLESPVCFNLHHVFFFNVLLSVHHFTLISQDGRWPFQSSPHLFILSNEQVVGSDFGSSYALRDNSSVRKNTNRCFSVLFYCGGASNSAAQQSVLTKVAYDGGVSSKLQKEEEGRSAG